MKKQRNYDKRVKNTRIFLGDYLVLKQISQLAGISMPEALHRLIAHQAQLPLLDMAIAPMPVTTARSMPVTITRSMPVTRARSTPITTSFSVEVENVTNGHRQID
ncbi:hypothetical protein ES703_114578 [subsurface metagenome]